MSSNATGFRSSTIGSVHRIGNEYLSHYFIRSKLKCEADPLVDLCWRPKYPIRCRKKQRREGEMGESAWVPKSYNPNRMFCLWCCSTHIHTHGDKSSLEHKHFALVTTKNHVKTTHRMHYNMVNDNRRQKIHTGKHNMLDVGSGFGRCITRTHTHTPCLLSIWKVSSVPFA